MKNKIFNTILSCIVVFVSCLVSTANAGLIDRGNGMIYDNVQNITWLQDANLAGMSMRWNSSMAWADNLSYGGFNDWRLPTINVSTQNGSCSFSLTGGTDCGYNVLTANSELAYMFYQNLGNVAINDTSGNTPQLGWNNLNTSFTDALTGNIVSFINLNRTHYWSGTEFAPGTLAAWVFNTYDGNQSFRSKFKNQFFAWAVRDGDVAVTDTTVPEPSTLAIFCLALLGLIARKDQL